MKPDWKQAGHMGRGRGGVKPDWKQAGHMGRGRGGEISPSLPSPNTLALCATCVLDVGPGGVLHVCMWGLEVCYMCICGA